MRDPERCRFGPTHRWVSGSCRDCRGGAPPGSRSRRWCPDVQRSGDAEERLGERAGRGDDQLVDVAHVESVHHLLADGGCRPGSLEERPIKAEHGIDLGTGQAVEAAGNHQHFDLVLVGGPPRRRRVESTVSRSQEQQRRAESSTRASCVSPYRGWYCDRRMMGCVEGRVQPNSSAGLFTRRPRSAIKRPPEGECHHVESLPGHGQAPDARQQRFARAQQDAPDVRAQSALPPVLGPFREPLRPPTGIGGRYARDRQEGNRGQCCRTSRNANRAKRRAARPGRFEMREKIKLVSSAGTGHYYHDHQEQADDARQARTQEVRSVVRKHVVYREDKIK